MEQMYLVEIFIDKVTIYTSPEDENSGANKKLIIKIKFGPKVQFIIKEGQLAANAENKDDIVDCDENGKRKWSRTIRVGKSYLFPSYPDTVLMILSKFPLEIEVWNDDENEEQIFVGIGTMHWETEFYHMLKETADACKLHEPLSIKQHTVLYAECCCKQVGEIAFILRLSALGESIITEFQQLMQDPDLFVFRTNKAPSMFQCKRIEGDDPNFCMVGSLYETTTLEDPTQVEAAHQKIEVCTELQSCGVGGKNANYTCADDGESTQKKKYPIEKIRMGDITGPCGNANCPLAHKVKTYIRNLEAYKKVADGNVTGTKSKETSKICGTCGCKDDRWHRDSCPAKIMAGETKEKATCSGCGGIVKAGETCEDRKQKLAGTGATPKTSKTQVTYVFSVTKVPDFKDSIHGKKFLTDSLGEGYSPPEKHSKAIGTVNSTVSRGCGCHKVIQAYHATNVAGTSTERGLDYKPSRRSMGLGTNSQLVYQLDAKASRRKSLVYNCTDITEDKDCKCDPPKPTPPCKTFDCDCIMETVNIAARKNHRPYCPVYKHKNNCPVTMMNEEEDKKEDEEDEAEPLPYGLPPIKLGPCPVMGRPCTVPDGFARMYRNAVLPTQPPSYSDAGKVCCSKEYERIKKALKEYMTYEKDHDFRCINKFNVDTERRCCDKEQVLMSLTGKGCCGSHKLAIQEKFKEERK